MHFPPLAALRAFAATAQAGNFSAAGRALNVTHAAVVQQVRALEAHLGVTLVHREGRGLGLTDEGAQLAQALDEGFGGIAAAVNRLRAVTENRPVTVTLTAVFAANWLMPRLRQFWQAHPGIAVSLRPDNRVLDLRREGIDLAIRFGNGSWPGVEAQYLTSARNVVVAAPSVVAGRHLAPADMARMPWVVEEGWPELLTWIGGLTGAAPTDLTATAFATEDLALGAARQGFGLYVATAANVANDIRDGHLVLVHDSEEKLPGYFVVTLPGPQRQAARVFAAWLRSAI